jgi:hypothetical protein
MPRERQADPAPRRRTGRAAARAPVLALLLCALAALSLPRRATSEPHTPGAGARSLPGRSGATSPLPKGSASPLPNGAAKPAPSPGALSVSVDAGRPAAVIAPDFLGLSLETPALASPAMTSGAAVLANLLRELGPGILRVSGDSVDHTQWLIPAAPRLPWSVATIGPGDLERLAALMRASGWRLILGLNLGHLLMPSLVEEARAASTQLGPSLAGLAIGNEPDAFTSVAPQPFRALLGGSHLRARGWGLHQYLAESASVRGALAAADVSAPIYGPETATDRWLSVYGAAEHAGLAALTPHLYPLIRCERGRVLVAHGPTAASLLSRGVAAAEGRQIAGFMRAASASVLPLRIDETNSVACGGQPHVSDTFAAALWALDYSLIAASHGVAGLNFHGGLGSCAAGGGILSPWYSPLCTLPGGRLTARPELYALLALRSLEGCAFVPVAYRTSANVSVYGLRAPDGTLHVVIDDMRVRVRLRAGMRAPAPLPLRVTLHVGPSYRSASVVRLLAPALTATQGVTLGGASLRADGTLPQPVPVPLQGAAGSFTVRVARASAAFVTLPAG